MVIVNNNAGAYVPSQVQRDQQKDPARDGDAGRGAQQLARGSAPPSAQARRRLGAPLRCHGRPPPRRHLVLPRTGLRGVTRRHGHPRGARRSRHDSCWQLVRADRGSMWDRAGHARARDADHRARMSLTRLIALPGRDWVAKTDVTVWVALPRSLRPNGLSGWSSSLLSLDAEVCVGAESSLAAQVLVSSC